VIAGSVLVVKRFSRLEKLLVTVQSPRVLMPVLVAVAVLTLSWCPEVVWGFQHRFEPVPSKWLYSLTFFVAGMAWAKHDPRLQSLARLSSPQMVAMAGIACVAAILMGRWYLEVSSPEGETRSARLLLAGLTVFAAWTIAVAGIAVGVARTRRVPESLQYLAGASFWLYIVHHPFLVLIHLDLKWLLPTVPGVVKMLISFASAVALTLAFYEVGVRRTRFGRWTGLGELVSTAESPENDPALLKLRRGEAGPAPLRRAA
jgi:glucans biosynthesis protein C